MTHTAVTLKGIVFHLGTLMFTTELVNSIFHLGKVTIYPLRFFFCKTTGSGEVEEKSSHYGLYMLGLTRTTKAKTEGCKGEILS